ncbi:MAG: helix-turn-helix domain-containing protein [Myxococcales bacterium]|nr:helix-turn-helix domain-containing protein [Myxococcales bacterium]MBK7197605.1 helix-turn-helix domain-containing protein [Myxococcales bacterium]
MSAPGQLDETIRSIVREVVREELAQRADARPANDSYLPTAEAAALVGVADGTIRRWIRERRLPSHRAGRVLRVRTSDLHQLLASGGQRPRKEKVLSPEDLARRDFGLKAG